MNVNLQNASPATPLATLFGDTVQSMVENNSMLMQADGSLTLTGRVALVAPRNSPMPGVYEVWHETNRDTWVWIDDEGVQHEKDCPVDSRR